MILNTGKLRPLKKEFLQYSFCGNNIWHYLTNKMKTMRVEKEFEEFIKLLNKNKTFHKAEFSIERAIKAVEISSRIEGNKTVKIDPLNWRQNFPLNKYRKAVNIVGIKTTIITGIDDCKNEKK